MKFVIYKQFGQLCVTTEENYKAGISNARAVTKVQGFKTAQEVIEYYCEVLGCKAEDFTIKGEI
jgi:hypothetical protein